MKLLSLSFFLILLSFATNSKDMSDLDNVILIKDSNSTLTLKDVAAAMGIKSSDFKTDYSMPTKREREDANIDLTPIIVWKNPQVIVNPNPPANRSLNSN
jgi:hypothetical protein